MGATEEKRAWEEYRLAELCAATSILQSLGYKLDSEQVHIGGERYLMARARDVGGGGRKLVLFGRDTKSGARVVIKVSSDPAGIAEIERERNARALLTKIKFASHAFFTPREILFVRRDPFVIAIIEYIEQERPFFARPVDEQFFISLHAFETQEGVHATTSEHARIIRDTFGMVSAGDYLAQFEEFRRSATAHDPGNAELAETFARAAEFLAQHRTTIERYGGFLTHTDFVPNNLRIRGRDFYLLDYASIHFGNKYESWARFTNFMIQHNRPLALALARYVRENRGEEEYLCLRLMRVYKMGFLLKFYAEALERAEGPLLELTRARVAFWIAAAQAVLDDTPLAPEIIEAYLKRQGELRTPDERQRQREMLGAGQEIRV
ncbi:hypothetical protein HY972_02480 [Candidatus Kaiserbacteria bacterium]|nr:hypothetical protein [Candidatus Kaiserbacteria bacterium]